MKINRTRFATLSYFIENIYNRYIVLLDLFVIYFCLFMFSKEFISFIGSIDKCHTSIFNALIIIFKQKSLFYNKRANVYICSVVYECCPMRKGLNVFQYVQADMDQNFFTILKFFCRSRDHTTSQFSWLFDKTN